MTHMDAHINEYAAAVAGMAETYGTRAADTYAVGDFVSGMTAGRRWSGHVEWIDGDRLGTACPTAASAALSSNADRLMPPARVFRRSFVAVMSRVLSETNTH